LVENASKDDYRALYVDYAKDYRCRAVKALFPSERKGQNPYANPLLEVNSELKEKQKDAESQVSSPKYTTKSVNANHEPRYDESHQPG